MLRFKADNSTLYNTFVFTDSLGRCMIAFARKFSEVSGLSEIDS